MISFANRAADPRATAAVTPASAMMSMPSRKGKKAVGGRAAVDDREHGFGYREPAGVDALICPRRFRWSGGRGQNDRVGLTRRATFQARLAAARSTAVGLRRDMTFHPSSRRAESRVPAGGGPPSIRFQSRPVTGGRETERGEAGCSASSRRASCLLQKSAAATTSRNAGGPETPAHRHGPPDGDDAAEGGERVAREGPPEGFRDRFADAAPHGLLCFTMTAAGPS